MANVRKSFETVEPVLFVLSSPADYVLRCLALWAQYLCDGYDDKKITIRQNLFPETSEVLVERIINNCLFMKTRGMAFPNRVVLGGGC